jgi:hypothetical protein
MESYFNENKAQLRKIGIKSPSGLIAYCLEHYPFETLIRGEKK